MAYEAKTYDHLKGGAMVDNLKWSEVSKRFGEATASGGGRS